MRTTLIGVAIVPVILALTACASPAAPSQAAAAAKAPAAKASEEGEGTKVNYKVGNFRRVTRGGKTFYCEKAEFVGSKMTKTRCLTEAEFKTFQERNEQVLEDLNRAQRSAQPVNDLPSRASGPN